ncbi:MAG TPA: endonuclease/exonuclease/phosphatase family protein [Actinophytocola sp.]|uniref:endonuclease/exonuclease/phosphatase family protein n=1 Tax=Actinophytocola sp. TaxID=1872138 RepID=UPI002DDD8AFF|nr:endonuclease/exonuclease/phosphatase family protein [Actinophytocola sp.]HEV2783025.1 endonuclease/exonuclease/phosphatase family protein [Actinophytocola sp.]
MRHGSRRWAVPAIPVALALFVLGPVTTVDSAPAPVATNPVRILQLNLCHSGIMDCYTGDAVMARARSVIASTGPQVLSVNEACADDVEPLRQSMGPARAVFVAAERPDGTPVTCTNGQHFGNLIMVAEALAGSVGVTGRFVDQDTGNEMRVWACLPAGVLTACTTHLSSHSGATALAQCHELMDRAAGYATTAPTVVAGDMNMRYRGTPNVQDCNRPGFYRKGDGSVQHVFATTTFTFVSGTKISMLGTTDHPAWLVTTTMG